MGAAAPKADLAVAVGARAEPELLVCRVGLPPAVRAHERAVVAVQRRIAHGANHLSAARRTSLLLRPLLKAGPDTFGLQGPAAAGCDGHGPTVPARGTTRTGERWSPDLVLEAEPAVPGARREACWS